MSYDKVSLLLPMNGANNGTVFTDWSPVPKTVTRTGAVTSTAQSKFYGSSGYFDGTADYLTVDGGDWFAFGTGDFTIRFWAYWSAMKAISHLDFRNGVADTPRPLLYNTFNGGAGATDLFYFVSNANRISAPTGTLAVGAWQHFEISRVSGTTRLFVDGTQCGSDYADSTNYTSAGSGNYIGRNYSVTSRDFNGYMQDFEIIKGVGLHSANFTPPARLIGTIDNSAVGASKILDVNGNPAERTVFAVPRAAPTRIWSDVSNASGEFEIWAPSGTDHSVVAVADETGLRNDIVHRVIPV